MLHPENVLKYPDYGLDHLKQIVALVVLIQSSENEQYYLKKAYSHCETYHLQTWTTLKSPSKRTPESSHLK